MTILTAHQPVYLPWLGLFHKIALADRFVSFNTVQYQAKDYNNRNKINTPQGPKWLTVPVQRKGRLERSYLDIEINNDLNWGQKHWRTLQANYSKAPYFKHYADYFDDVYKREWTYLVDLNEAMLQWFLDTLGIAITVERADGLALKGAKSDLVLDMCIKLDSGVYIFGANGKDYADRKSFADASIKLLFQDYQHPEYTQSSHGFQPYMSIIDLLFHHGDNSLETLMSGNLTKSDLLIGGS